MSDSAWNGVGERYLLADSRHTPLARAVLESPPEAANWQVRILDDRIGDVMEHELVRMAGISGDAPALIGRIIRRRGERIVVEPVRALEEDIRHNLRMPVDFDTFLYPLTGTWKGRRSAKAHDLSCGGIAFYCAQVLEDGERAEVVIPITAEPLVLCCEVIRCRLSTQRESLYACKFVDLCNDEERMVREAAFSVQLRDSGRN